MLQSYRLTERQSIGVDPCRLKSPFRDTFQENKNRCTINSLKTHLFTSNFVQKYSTLTFWFFFLNIFRIFVFVKIAQNILYFSRRMKEGIFFHRLTTVNRNEKMTTERVLRTRRLVRENVKWEWLCRQKKNICDVMKLV